MIATTYSLYIVKSLQGQPLHTMESSSASWKKLQCKHYVDITDEEAEGLVWCPYGDGWQYVVKEDQ